MKGILEYAKKIEGELIANRRHIHINPEVGLELPKTTAFVMEKLKEMGLEPKEISKSGVVATIGNGGKTILLRGDMDALPAKKPQIFLLNHVMIMGIFNGHDMHTAILLGVAKILKEKESELRGTVKLMFQQGEETGAGAKAMVEACAENPRVDSYGRYVSADLEPGKIEFTNKIASASMDTWLLEVQGRGGHSSTPHLAIDPLMIVNTLYTMLNSLVGKEVDPFETAILTVGKMGGGTVANVIPDTAVLEGAFRCFDKKIRDHIVKRVDEIIEDVVKTMRGTYTVNKISTPSIYNNEELCNIMKPYIEEIVGKGNLSISQKPLSGTEDFSYISEKVPSMYIWAGAKDENNNYPLHNPNIVLDEKVLSLGAAVLANCAINWLKDNN